MSKLQFSYEFFLFLFFWLPFISFLILASIQHILRLFSAKIINNLTLQEIFEKECDVLGLSHLQIKLIYTCDRGGRSRKLNDGSYQIECNWDSTFITVAHELAHIKNGDADLLKAMEDRLNGFAISPDELTKIKKVLWWAIFLTFLMIKWTFYVFWFEPRATLYELKRLRALNRQPNPNPVRHNS